MPARFSAIGFFLLSIIPGFSATLDPASFQLHPQLEMALFAREPDVVDPVALCFDEKGRMFVVEMIDYPYGIGPDKKPGGRVRILEDLNGDGVSDRSTIFAEGLSFPTSIAPWKGGVFITAPPEILYLKDTNNDGKADLREAHYSGFVRGVTDSNVNGLRWGLDNRLHGLNGGNGGTIKNMFGAEALSIRDVDFSFVPGTADIEPSYHTSSGFGQVFDEFGRSFVTYNIDHIQQRIIPVRYLKRFPGMPPLTATLNISDHEAMSRIYPISKAETRPNHPEQAGHFSSAGGMGYLGFAGFPGDLPGSIFVCDVVGNLVHRDVLIPDGPIFKASRSLQETNREFFASRDNAFRPVGLELGPDGALYLIDMQRDVIEHPDYIPEKVKARIDIRAGDDRGRIYRITPKSEPKVKSLHGKGLVARLADPNPFWRQTSQRLIVESQEKRYVPELEKMLEDRTAHFGRLHALWTLQGLGALHEKHLLAALEDPVEGIRENAVLLSEAFLKNSGDLQKAVREKSADTVRVRFQTALTLGQFEEDFLEPLYSILQKDFAHRWSRVAVWSSLRQDEFTLYKRVLDSSAFRKNLPAAAETLKELADLMAARGQAPLADVLTILATAPQPWVEASLEGLNSGFTRNTGNRKVPGNAAALLDRLLQRASTSTQLAGWRLARTLQFPTGDSLKNALQNARAQALNPNLSTAERAPEIKFLSLSDFEQEREHLASLLDAREKLPLQKAALQTLQEFNSPKVGQVLVQRWRKMSPELRPDVVNLLVYKGSYHEALLSALEKEELKTGELNLDLEHRRRLLRFTLPNISRRAAKFFSDEEYSNRKQVADDLFAKLPASGSAAKGRALFEKNCAACHKKGSLGASIGPDLTDVSHRSMEDLLYNIVDPNMAINPNYVAYKIETDEIEVGLIQSESDQAITLVQAQGQAKTIPKKSIKNMETTGLSLMPEGLEASLTPQDFRDLIEFLHRGQ